MFFTAFLMGLVGSLHCVGMCGPLTLLLPQSQQISPRYIIGRGLYNLGRIFTYASLGLLVGLLGQQSTFFVSLKIISIVLGLALIAFVIMPQRWFNSSGMMARFTGKLKNAIKQTFELSYFGGQLSFGLINGLLPCGLVYAALSGAFLTLDPWLGAGFMGLFGLGTLPLMYTVSLSAGYIKKLLGKHSLKIISATYLLIGSWLVVRGFIFDTPQLHGYNVNELIQLCKAPFH